MQSISREVLTRTERTCVPMKKLIAFALAACTVAAAGVTGATAAKHVGPFAGAIHADVTAQLKDGSTACETMDRGKVTAVDASSITILRPDGQSLTFSLAGDVAVREEGKDGTLDDIKVDDRLMVFATGGQAFLLRCISHPKARI